MLRAFAAEKIKLIDTSYGSLQPVVALAGSSRTWDVGVYVYRNTGLATQSVKANLPQWRASGFAVNSLKNVVVTVVYHGGVLGSSAHARALPPSVAKAISKLAGH